MPTTKERKINMEGYNEEIVPLWDAYHKDSKDPANKYREEGWSFDSYTAEHVARRKEIEKLDEEFQQLLVDRVKQICNDNGITLSVIGCGCCESPSVTFVYKGEVIVENFGHFNI